MQFAPTIYVRQDVWEGQVEIGSIVDCSKNGVEKSTYFRREPPGTALVLRVAANWSPAG